VLIDLGHFADLARLAERGTGDRLVVRAIDGSDTATMFESSMLNDVTSDAATRMRRLARAT
jgi:hypothetical protein